MDMAPGPEKEGKPCYYMTSCWAHEGAWPPQLPVQIEGWSTTATLDSGSAITLIQPQWAGPWTRQEVVMGCVHRDTQSYPVSHVSIQPEGGAGWR